MTMPHELTRALRWGWEFLLELQASDPLTSEQRVQVDQLLVHYPSAKEIRAWAAMVGTSQFDDILGVEDEDVSRADVPEHIERPPVAVEQYMQAIAGAGLFFRELRSAGNLPESLRRQVPYVLRHYPLQYNRYGIERLIARAMGEK